MFNCRCSGAALKPSNVVARVSWCKGELIWKGIGGWASQKWDSQWDARTPEASFFATTKKIQRDSVEHSLFSQFMDWFRGKNTGHPHIEWPMGFGYRWSRVTSWNGDSPGAPGNIWFYADLLDIYIYNNIFYYYYYIYIYYYVYINIMYLFIYIYTSHVGIITCEVWIL